MVVMRILLSFLIGLISSFLLGEAILRVFKRPLHSLIGILIIIFGFITGFVGKYYLGTPLDILLSLYLIGSGTGLTLHHLLTSRYILSERLETNFVKKHENFFERAIEILPGAMTWIALTSPFWLSLALPFAVAYIIIIADVYWLISALRVAILIIVGYNKMKWAKNQPWLEKLKVDYPDTWYDYYHVFLLPTYNENAFILRPAVEAVANLNYPKDRVFLSIGLEQRNQQRNPEIFLEKQQLAKEFDSKMAAVFAPIHPVGLEGEVPGPATNRNWMLQDTVKELNKRKIDLNKVIITTLDADYVVHQEFLGGLLHKYLSTPKELQLKRSFTGCFFYYNNYWDAPTPMRLIATGTALWQLAEMVGSDKYQNFSSMSINLKSLQAVGGWIPNKVNDDSGFYWKAYFHFKGDYKVIPHFMPITGDTVLDETLFKTFVNQYQQLKRWAYGVEHLPFVFKQYFKRTDIDFWDKTDKLLFVLWGNLKWGTLALIVTFAGLIIPLINPDYNQSVVAVNLPIVSSWILTAAFLGLFSTIYVQEKTVPKRPKGWSFIQRVWSYLQYLLVPVVLVTISTLPAIDAQTRLMFGKYIEYRATNKARAKN